MEKNKIVKIYIDRASQYAEITRADGSQEHYSTLEDELNEPIEIVFERDERDCEVIQAEQESLGRNCVLQNKGDSQ
jgi:hypothetical protein